MLAEGGQVGVPLELLEVVVAGGEGGFQGGQGQRDEPVSLGLLLGRQFPCLWTLVTRLWTPRTVRGPLTSCFNAPAASFHP